MKCFFTCTIIIIFNFIVFSQSHHVILQPNIDLSIVQIFDSQTNQITYSYGTYDYGVQVIQIPGNTDYISKFFNTAYKFDLSSIPDNALNLSAALEAHRTGSSYGDGEITTLIDNNNFNYLEGTWDNVENDGEYLFTVDHNTGVLHDITADVSARLSQNYINFGCRRVPNTSALGNIDFYLHVYYDLDIVITADNNFITPGNANHGTIMIDGENKTIPLTGYSITRNEGADLTLGANSPQNDNQNHQMIWHSGSINPSDWRRNNEFKWYNQSKTFTVSENDDGKIYIANLRKNYAISRRDQFEFDQSQLNNNLWYCVEQNSRNISAPSTIPLNGKSYNFSYWTDNISEENSREILPNDNETYTAFYKYKMHSNNQGGYSSGSQRKFVRTRDGNLHYVYESVGHIWYERSTDNGANWDIMNNGKPVDDFNIGGPTSSPAIIDIYTEDDAVAICYFSENILIVQRYKSGIKVCQNYFSNFFSGTNPTIAFRSWGNDKILVVWQESSGISYALWDLGISGGYEIAFQSSGFIPHTNLNSSNPSCVGTIADYNNPAFHLVWQQGLMEIKYYQLTIIYNNITFKYEIDPIDYTYATFSAGSPYDYNTNPSISVAGCLPPDNSGVPIVSWIGSFYSNPYKTLPKDELVTTSFKMITRRGLGGSFCIAGNNVTSTNNNSTVSADENTVIAWSEGDPAVTKWIKRSRSNYSSTFNMVNSGIETQISNGSSLTDIRAMVYNTETSPYSFNFTDGRFDQQVIHPGLEKVSTDSIHLTYGRSGIVSKNGVNFVFNIGDIILADTNIQFIPRPDTIIYANSDDLNQVTRSSTFHLDNQSQLYFTNYYYTVNSDIADSALTGTDRVTFKAELVNAITNSVVGTFDEITYTKNNLEDYDNVNYQVDCSNISEGDYYLRLKTAVDGEAIYNLANIQNDNPELGKRNYKDVDFKGNQTPVAYDLSQNYPNPFNPTTTINYQLPEAGYATIKIYDILGKEVATLVNEQKNQGRYSVNFDASHLASGVYIYQLKVKDYVSSKKMLLLK
ncbi:MAG: T9SS type A sorting domain-containing protein [Ignavibacteriaceae bacterium]